MVVCIIHLVMKMKRYQIVLITILLVVLGPALVFFSRNKTPSAPQMETEPVVIEKEKTIRVLDNGTVVEMSLDEYLISVVLSEMPAKFEPEALKAQAVVARTYALRRVDKGKHDDAAVCTESSCCQGYKEETEYLSSGGKAENVEKVRKAVLDTKDQVLIYDGKLIDATYFSCSGGVTEDAVAVWGADVPYLQSIESPGEEIATHFTDTVRISTEEFVRKLNLTAKGNASNWVESVTYTDGGGVDTVKICGKEFKGTQLRKLLKLRSTAFAITVLGGTVTITTKGYGHRVGMSQYGAQSMALEGKNYQDILTHYYTGVTLSQFPLED